MEIVDELEPVRRGVYGGTLGYFDLRGNADFCIAIRTLLIEDGRATVQAGAGIVADSDPAAELRETEAKAGAMMEALRVARSLCARGRRRRRRPCFSWPATPRSPTTSTSTW